MKKYDVTALGELLIDFTENGVSNQSNPYFEANPGGAPCNVLAMLTSLGRQTAFIGKVGDDHLGHFLENILTEIGISTQNLLMDEKIHTTLAFVHTLPDGDRDFSFYRNPGADMMLTKEEIQTDLIKQSRLFHFGTLSSTHQGARAATRYALDIARQNHLLISFDPNLRPPLWDSLEDAKKEILYGMQYCDILKISDNEMEFLFGDQDYDAGAAKLRAQYGIPLILVTLGKNGSVAYYQDTKVFVPSFSLPDTIETTGAGDTFCACVLNYILDKGLEGLTREDLSQMLLFANAAAALITSRKGALRVMPTKEEVLKLLQSNHRSGQ